MHLHVLVFCILINVLFAGCSHLSYLDPTKLQTKTSPDVQQRAAFSIIQKYIGGDRVVLEVDPNLFSDKKDVFSLRSRQNVLHIRASSGVAAVWGFNYYLKKYCKSHIGWQVQRVAIPDVLPEVDETVIANDRFRYYQNVCTASYSFVWWDTKKWSDHVEWMAMNGINLALAPIAQEDAWARVYRSLGMTEEEINEHFTGPAFLAWLRMGNVRGWGGPLPKSWNNLQKDIQDTVLSYMSQLGMIPIYPAFNGHVPRAFQRIFPNVTYYAVEAWNDFGSNYCCGSFLSPREPLFETVGKMFVKQVTLGSVSSHIYAADPFNEVKINTDFASIVPETAKAIYATISEVDSDAVWLVQNWMFVHDANLWPTSSVKQFLTAVPIGRMLVLDLQSEQWPQYDVYPMYYGQPFIWCMLHNFGGTLGMFGDMKSINRDVYDARARPNSTMVGVGLTPEGINQNYVVYDLMLESAWRTHPVSDMNKWAEDYAERRYGCNATRIAWKYLLKSVYSFDALNKIRGKYVVTRRPSFKIKPWAWYKSQDLFEAWKHFVFVDHSDCYSPSFEHDLVDVTRQALQYRAEQLFLNIWKVKYSTSWVFNATMLQFLDVMRDMKLILASNSDFTMTEWLSGARSLATSPYENYLYEMNARNQITLWGPNGEISDYACKQWAEIFEHYYIPRWTMFLQAALDAKVKNEIFDEKNTLDIIRSTVENSFMFVKIDEIPRIHSRTLALNLYKKWSNVPGLQDLPLNIIKRTYVADATLSDLENDDFSEELYTTILLGSTNLPSFSSV